MWCFWVVGPWWEKYDLKTVAHANQLALTLDFFRSVCACTESEFSVTHQLPPYLMP